MKKQLFRRLAAAASLLLVTHTGFAQALGPAEQARALIKEGVGLHDAGRYEAAIAKYQQALALQPTDIVAKAELAMTFNQIGKYEQAVTLCREAIATAGEHGPSLYATYANSLDALQKPTEAEQVYKEGLQQYPKQYLLLYNLGVTQQGLGKSAEAQQSFQQALEANPGHPGSNVSWGVEMMTAGNRIPAMLALATFLMLEPNSQRSAENLHRLRSLMEAGMQKTESGATIISVTPQQLAAAKKGRKKGRDNFASKELMLALMGAVDSLPGELAANPVEVFGFKFGGFVQQLGAEKGHPTGFAWVHYVPFFSALEQGGHIRTFAYLVHLSDDEKPYVREWLQQHPQELKDLVGFMQRYKWPE